VKETTDIVEKFVANVSCDNDDLSTFIIRCGCLLPEPTLTVITGPGNSGKSALASIVRNLYGPFATWSGDYDSKLVRTCFFAESSILNDAEAVANHKCKHLVVVCDDSDHASIASTFGGRKVHTLKLESTIEKSDTKKNIVASLSTRKQMASLLGWAAKNYTPSDVSVESEPESGPANEMMARLMLRMLTQRVSAGNGCESSDCTNCGSHSNAGSQ
jgi:hypothetical protein